MYNKYNLGTADLHTHTKASDGLLGPRELIKYAKQKGLDLVAITDHDTTDSIPIAVKYGKELGIEVIPGIEINTYYNNEEVHILGYFFDIYDTRLQRILKDIKNSRINRARLIVDNLVKLYDIDINYEEVVGEVEGAIVTRPHIARLLIKKGLVKDIAEAFDKYLGTNCPAYVERYKITPEEGINLINIAGGVAVLAHPGQLKDQRLIRSFLLKLNFKGIEVYHSKHLQEHVHKYAKLAYEKHLIATGGSDCHGELINGYPMIGDVTISLNEVNSLRSASIFAT